MSTSQQHLSGLIAMADLFIDLELSMEKYYDLCAKIFPDEKYAWFGIATQEGIHAKIFQKIKDAIKQSPEKWSLGKYNSGVLKTMIDLIHQKIKEIEAKNYNSKFIITFAKDFESSLIESDILNSFVAESGEYRTLIEKIIEETGEHKDFLNRFLASREVF